MDKFDVIEKQVVERLSVGILQKIIERKLLSQDVIESLFYEVKSEQIERFVNRLKKLNGDE